jgi:hypothetical protein
MSLPLMYPGSNQTVLGSYPADSRLAFCVELPIEVNFIYDVFSVCILVHCNPLDMQRFSTGH